MIEVGLARRDEYGADAIVIGCTGMARYRDELELAVLSAAFPSRP
jgi:Asp/Glu/hydantoin racemase